MRRCVLHIGWHKTGTTALQHFLHAQADLLAARGVVYPTFSANHSAFLPAAFVGEASATYSETFVPPLTGHEAVGNRTAARAVTDDVFSDSRSGTFVLSAEDLCLLDRDAIIRCRDRLSSTFDSIEVVAYLRNHGDYAHSATQQLVRMGFTMDEIVAMARTGGAPIQVLEPLPHYARRLGDWIDVVGPARVHVFGYDDLRAAGRSVLDHFLIDVLGLDDPVLNAAAEHHPRTNSSSSSASIHVMNRMNTACPLFVSGAPNPGFQFNRQRYLRAIDGPNATAPIELFDPVAQAHAGDVAELARQLGSEAPQLAGPVRASFGGSTAELDGDSTIGQLADALGQAVANALLGTARQKLLASLLRLDSPAARPAAVRQIHLARFLMADQQQLINSARLLLNAAEHELAQGYVDKASRFADRPDSLVQLIERLSAAATPST